MTSTVLGKRNYYFTSFSVGLVSLILMLSSGCDGFIKCYNSVAVWQGNKFFFFFFLITLLLGLFKLGVQPLSPDL